MTAIQFQDLQEAMLYVFLPMIHWLLAILVAGGFLSSVWVMWFYLLRWLTGKGEA